MTRVEAVKQPFREHVQELRRRAIISVAAVLVGAAVAYSMHNAIFAWLQRPLGEKLYYTSPIGGFNSVIKISLSFGIVLALPVIMYQISQFLAPAFKFKKSYNFVKLTISSLVLGLIGVTFAYYVSLPSSLHFLTNLGVANVQPFIVVNEYLNFVFSYLVGFAVLFQLPILLHFINRIKPQSPRKLMKYQRYVILGSFLIAAILTPTPDPFNQLLMALPVILLYQISILIVWVSNRRSSKTAALASSVIEVAPRQEEVTPPVFAPVPVPQRVVATPLAKVVQPRQINTRLIMDIIPRTLKDVS